MKFYIDKGYYKALDALANEAKKSAMVSQVQLQRAIEQPTESGKGLHLEKLQGNAGKRGFCSARANDDVRLIYHQDGENVILCHVGHHQPAYQWADRKKIMTHPTTGALQLVTLREKVIEQIVPKFVELEPELAQAAPAKKAKAKKPKPARKPFENVSADDLLSYGVPPDWTDIVQQSEESDVEDLIAELPEEAGEALRILAIGGKPEPAAIAGEEGVSSDPYEHPDAKRRFQLVATDEEVQQALDGHWEPWTVFLHPQQRAMVEKVYNGPARAMGSAGTGKTVVALHRAAKQGRDGREVLLCTFSRFLARSLQQKLTRLMSKHPEAAKRVKVRALDEVGIEYYAAARGTEPKVATPNIVKALVKKATKDEPDHLFSPEFVYEEFTDVIDAWQIESLEQYLDLRRIGRKRQVGKAQREILWRIFERVRQSLKASGTTTMAGVFAVATEYVEQQQLEADVAVDEAPDVSLAQPRLEAALAGDRPDGLFFAGDLGQRIFQAPFSWRELGVDVRGRSKTLKVNYRTSHEIRSLADRLLDPQVGDVDGEVDDRGDTVSAFRGPMPTVDLFDDRADEVERVSAWLRELGGSGIDPSEIAVLVRSEALLDAARQAVAGADLHSGPLHREAGSDGVAVGLMHDAKGLEFRAVAVMACDEDVLPDPDRVAAASDEAELAEVDKTERHLLYVACTRSRDQLLVTGLEPGSEYLADVEVS